VARFFVHTVIVWRDWGSVAHVSSLSWAVEAGVRIRNSMTVTEKRAYWVMPNGVKDVPYAPVKSIEFVGKKRSITAIQTLQCSRG